MDLKDSEVRRYLEFQDNKCFLCLEPITVGERNLKAVKVDKQTIEQVKLEKDHIIAKSLPKGIDSDENYAIMHQKCNRRKGTKPLLLARRIFGFERDKKKYGEELTLRKVLQLAREKYSLGASIKQVLLRKPSYGIVEVQFKTRDGEEVVQTLPLIEDPTGSKFKSFFVTLPIQYVTHDSELNPRPISEKDVNLIEEFYYRRPQLHVCLARLGEDELSGDWKRFDVLLFDGQHKATAQIYNDRARLLLRVFVEYDKNKLKDVNFRAHTDLVQMEFFKSIAARVGHGLFADDFKKYLNTKKGLRSERDFYNSLDHQKKRTIKKDFKQWLKHGILHPEDTSEIDFSNLMTPYIEEERTREKKKPISYYTFERTFLRFFVYQRFSSEPLEEAKEYLRFLERENVVKLMNIISQKALIDKFNFQIGTFKLESRRRKGERIPEEHLRAYRLFRPRVAMVWCETLKNAISTYLRFTHVLTDTYSKQGKIFWAKIDDEGWKAIENMVSRIVKHKLWLTENLRAIEVMSSNRKEPAEALLTEGKIDREVLIKKPINFAYVMGQQD